MAQNLKISFKTGKLFPSTEEFPPFFSSYLQVFCCSNYFQFQMCQNKLASLKIMIPRIPNGLDELNFCSEKKEHIFPLWFQFASSIENKKEFLILKQREMVTKILMWILCAFLTFWNQGFFYFLNTLTSFPSNYYEWNCKKLLSAEIWFIQISCAF